MYNFLLRKGTSIAFILGFIASFIVIYVVVSGASGLLVDDFPNLYQVNGFGTAVLIGVIFVLLGIVAIFLGGAYGLITNPKSVMKFVIGGGLLAVIVVVLYSMSVDEVSGPIRSLTEEYDIQGTISRMISAGILATVLLFVIAIGVVLLAEVRNVFK